MLIAAQPTRGLDVGAIEFVHRRLIEERDEGRAILLVSLELDEILSLSDRILVIYEGEIVGEYPPTATRRGARLAMIGGGRGGGGRVSAGRAVRQPPAELRAEQTPSAWPSYQRAGGPVALITTVAGVPHRRLRRRC